MKWTAAQYHAMWARPEVVRRCALHLQRPIFLRKTSRWPSKRFSHPSLDKIRHCGPLHGPSPAHSDDAATKQSRLLCFVAKRRFALCSLRRRSTTTRAVLCQFLKARRKLCVAVSRLSFQAFFCVVYNSITARSRLRQPAIPIRHREREREKRRFGFG